MRRIYILLAACLLCSAVACTGNVSPEGPGTTDPETPENPETPDDPDNPPAYVFLSDEAPETLSAAEKENVAAINGFAFKMAKEIGALKVDESYVYSPVSISYALGVLACGAAGNTRKEICSVLGFGADGQQALNEFNRNLMVISQRSAAGGEVLEVANAAVIRKDINLYERYKKSVKNYYDAELFIKDFSAEDIATFVNSWAASKTHGRIDHVLDDVDVTCVALILNALYFKASWASPFESGITSAEPFKPEKGDSRKEKMMKQQHEFKYYKGETFSMVKLPYGISDNYTISDSNYSMSLILPAGGRGVDEIIGSLDGEKWTQAQAAMSYSTIDLWLPRFDIKIDKYLTECFKHLGMKDAFTDAADFSEMCAAQLQVSFIKQVANISVDENGTEAAAVTVVGKEYGELADPPKPVAFHCDRPFIFAITEQTTGAILFMGCYK